MQFHEPEVVAARGAHASATVNRSTASKFRVIAFRWGARLTLLLILLLIKLPFRRFADRRS
jgi:hypothetical protein